jgi:hypothetical protein
MVRGAARTQAGAEKSGAAVSRARGNVRRLDHLNCLAVDIKANRIFFETYLGCRLTEQIVLDDGTVVQQQRLAGRPLLQIRGASRFLFASATTAPLRQ